MAEWLARFRQAMSLLPDGVVIVTGSIYLIADMLAGGRRDNASIM